ncbi:MAG: hypothetical protein JSV91_03385 [Phycisphaerales bacterium]|nr:MAG: hypothetical protein JSV91_03385 [Phycisphaerales bacterium]
MTQPPDPFDELAAMFLTEPDAADQVRGRGQQTVTIELLAVGHLPVRGGLWLTPYADAVAREVGPTVLLRMDGEETSLQLLRGESDVLSPLVKKQPQPTLPETVRNLGPAVSTWVLRPPTDCGPEDMVRAEADRITILSSADEAAVVAAYQLVKNLADAAERIQHPLPEIALAVLGADSASAASVLDRLRRTTLQCLGVDVALVMCLTRMDAGIRSAGYMRFAGRPAPILADVVQWIDRRPIGDEGEEEEVSAAQAASDEQAEAIENDEMIAPQRERGIRPQRMMPRVPGLPAHGIPGAAKPAEPPEPPQAPEFPREPPQDPHTEAPSPVEEALEELDRIEKLLAGRAKQVEPEIPQAEPASGEPEAPIPDTKPAGRIKLIPTPHVAVEPKTPAQPGEPDKDGLPVALAEYVAGLTALPVRCPGHERIEIALDRQGVMHLLGREDALREMRFVETWAHAHRELITMACREHNIDPAGRTICHVFTDSPASVADLHGTDLRLHVLAPVDVEGKRGWYAAALNKPHR